MGSCSNHQLLTIVLILICCLQFPVSSEGQLLPIVNYDGSFPSPSILTYIVHVRRPKGARLLSSHELRAWHESYLPNKTLDSGERRLIYSYRYVISGFAAKLTAEEVRAMEAKDGFVLAEPEQMHQFATTYTPQFLGLSQWDGAWYDSNFYGQDIIIGVLDTGMVNNHPSFSDDGMPPKPPGWQGSCDPTSGIICNGKIIGAAGFDNGVLVSAVDIEGHGTHVASTAAGNFVANANVLDTAPGIASGTAPRAYLSIYKVCSPKGCSGSNILAGMEKAIGDGVHIVSLSIGSVQREFHLDSAVLASMGAFVNGISPVVAAGNDGPTWSTLAHEAPWALTIGASTTDRKIRSTVVLGNNKELHGESAFQPSNFDPSMMLPIAFPGEYGQPKALYCKTGSLSYVDVYKKLVLCMTDRNNSAEEQASEVYRNGGSGMILMNTPVDGYTTFSTAHLIPASHLNVADSQTVRNYYQQEKNSPTGPTATIKFGGTVFGHRPTPAVASFSSRGPATLNGGILKPDILAPGVNILAAWHTEVGPNPTGTLTSTFNYDSGTSMAAPHVSGIVALVRRKYMSWPPSAVHSAMITSAYNFDLDGNYIFDENYNGTASIFAVGAGQVNATNALNPGLIYYLDTNDYIRYVCGIGYSDLQASAIFKQQVYCSTVQKIGAAQLNYPSITLHLRVNSRPVTIQRTVTNVGEAMSTYRARIVEPFGISVYLSTYELHFSRVNQEISFAITFAINTGPGKGRTVSGGQIQWVSHKHTVTSPIAIAWV